MRDRTRDLGLAIRFCVPASLRARAIGDAVVALEKLVARDPTFAPAWATLSEAHRRSLPDEDVATLRTGQIEEARRLAETARAKPEMAARRAIELDPKNAAGYGALGALQTQRGKWLKSEDLLKRAPALDANEPDVLFAYSYLISTLGRVEEGLSLIEKARALEPLVTNYSITVGYAMQATGQHAESIPLLEAIMPNPANPALNSSRNTVLARAYAAVGRYSEAADMLLAVPSNQSRPHVIEEAARLLRTAPARANAPELLATLEPGLNFVYAHVGAFDRILEFLSGAPKSAAAS